VKRHILIYGLGIYGLAGGVLVTLLKLMEFCFLVVERSLEIYGGLVAAVFAALGIWLGTQVDQWSFQADLANSFLRKSLVSLRLYA
jgi:hypothetical protein